MSNSPEQLCSNCPNQSTLRKVVEFALRSAEPTDGCEGPLYIHRGQAESATVTTIYSHGKRSEVIGEEQSMKDWHSMTMHTEYPNLKDLDSDDFLRTEKTDTYYRTNWASPVVQCGQEQVEIADGEIPYREFQGNEWQDNQGRRNAAFIRGSEDALIHERGMSATMWMLDNVEPDISVTKDSSGNIETTISTTDHS